MRWSEKLYDRVDHLHLLKIAISPKQCLYLCISKSYLELLPRMNAITVSVKLRFSKVYFSRIVWLSSIILRIFFYNVVGILFNISILLLYWWGILHNCWLFSQREEFWLHTVRIIVKHGSNHYFFVTCVEIVFQSPRVWCLMQAMVQYINSLWKLIICNT